MSLDHDAPIAELFGLAGSFPRPGWVVLDAARDHRFTGELAFDTTPEVRVYLDRGRIYLAERTTDPPLGARLVDAGALNAAQLEHGAMRIGESEHLGRLFERVPSVDRHAVLITTELMTEECVGWIAGRRVPAASATPYRHHPSGVHRWERSPDAVDLAPGDPLPAPPPDEPPVELAPPEPIFDASGPPTLPDDMIAWDEPSWLDEHPPRDAPTRSTAGSGEAAGHGEGVARVEDGEDVDERFVPHEPGRDVGSDLSIGSDWIDRLASEGLPEPGTDPLASPTRLPPVAADPVDRFEVIWPSGEIDEQFGASDVAEPSGHHPDIDRPGPTARLARGPTAQAHDAEVPAHTEPYNGDAVAVPASAAPTPAPVPDAPNGDHPGADAPPDAEADVEVTDEVVLAVRRAVASIETGSIAARRRLVDEPDDDSSRGHDIVPPGRVAVRDDDSEWAPGGPARTSETSSGSRSVFDEIPIRTADDRAPTLPEPAPAAVEQEPSDDRVGALRRLIGALRRR